MHSSVGGARHVGRQGWQQPRAGARVARGHDVLARRGAGEEVALSEPDALLDEPGALGLRLYALGDERHAYALGEELDGPHEVLVLERGADAAREAGVELEERDGQPVERCQGGVAAAEVVEGDANAGLAQALEDARAGVVVLQGR